MLRNKGRLATAAARNCALSLLCLMAGAAIWAAHAQAPAPGSGLATSYAANADKPIDIEADALEVDDKKKVATFKGNVSATQGDFNLRAKEIQVTYVDGKKGGAKKDPAASAASPLPGGGGEIEQIDAKGKVLMTAKDNQTATSDWAVFEVKKQLVTIGGDVVLTQGTNTMTGSKMVIDLTTGITRLETGDGKTAGGPAGRIKAIFTPKERTAKSKDKAGAEAKAETPAN
jgi:lipopolysaccharide export system protein LptA